MGECGKIHSKKLRAEYEQARREGKVDYDRDLRKRLEILVEDCDRKIYRGLRRIEDENRCNKGLLPISKIIDSEGVRQLTEEIEKRKEALEEESLEDESDEVVSLEKRRAELQAEACMGTFMEEEKRRLGMNTRSEGATIGEEDKRRLEEKIKLAERLAEEGRTDEVQIVLAEFECMEAEFRAPPPKTRDDKKVRIRNISRKQRHGRVIQCKV